MSTFNALDNCLEGFGNLITRRGREIYAQTMKMVPKEINEELTMMTRKGDLLHEVKIKCSVSSHVTDFRNSEQYLIKMNERAQKDEKVFVVHKIGQKLVYGKVLKVNSRGSFRGRLLSHSLTLTEDPTDALLIPFDDLKQFSDPRNFYTFIIVSADENHTSLIVIKMLNKEKTHHFVNLCTGEYGPTYKGASFTMERNKYSSDLPGVINVPHFMENGCEVSRPVDFNFSDEYSDLVECKASQLYVSFQSKTGGFQIFNVNETKDLESIVGEAIMRPVFCPTRSDVEPANFKIVDCGIALDI